VPTRNIEQLGDALNYLDDNAMSKGADIIDVLQRMGGVADRLDFVRRRRLAPRSCLLALRLKWQPVLQMRWCASYLLLPNRAKVSTKEWSY
jgi:hypothetical protein